DYGPAAAALLSIVALVVVFVVNSKVANTLKKIIRLKDDTRNEKSKVIVEAFRVISKLQQTSLLDYKNIADELEEVYGRMYSTISDPKLIAAYHRVVTIFILGNKPSLLEFEALSRKELGLPIVNSKNKQNYLLMMNNEEERIKANQQLEEQKRQDELELQQQKQYLKEQKEKEKALKRLEKEEQKTLKQKEKEVVQEVLINETPVEKVVETVEIKNEDNKK
ncbi:MAG: hypothetical protein CVV59_01080, partial [Tenericutes bacterium HGW-Tenericutes-4]